MLSGPAGINGYFYFKWVGVTPGRAELPIGFLESKIPEFGSFFF